jgi:putative methionine-R-sulfoxide reductase with GAF domain
MDETSPQPTVRPHVPLNQSISKILRADDAESVLQRAAEAVLSLGIGTVRAWQSSASHESLHPLDTSSAVAPLVFDIAGDDGVLGGLSLFPSRPVSSEVLEVVEALAAVAGEALSTLSLKLAARKAAVVSSALCDAAHLAGLAPTLPFDDLLARITELTMRLVAAERVTLYLADEVRRELYCVESLSDASPKHVRRIPFGRGIAGAVAATRAPARVSDASADPSFDPSVDEATGSRTHAMLCLPICLPSLSARGLRLLGVLQVLNKMGAGRCSSDAGAEFTASDEHVLVSFCDEIAAVLEGCERELIFEKVCH